MPDGPCFPPRDRLDGLRSPWNPLAVPEGIGRSLFQRFAFFETVRSRKSRAPHGHSRFSGLVRVPPGASAGFSTPSGGYRFRRFARWRQRSREPLTEFRRSIRASPLETFDPARSSDPLSRDPVECSSRSIDNRLLSRRAAAKGGPEFLPSRSREIPTRRPCRSGEQILPYSPQLHTRNLCRRRRGGNHRS